MSRAMTKLNSPKRKYDSTRRQAQADETRRQILTAAHKLFIERGYAGATIEAIAAEAELLQKPSMRFSRIREKFL